jgi:hypothetical protein
MKFNLLMVVVAAAVCCRWGRFYVTSPLAYCAVDVLKFPWAVVAWTDLWT